MNKRNQLPVWKELAVQKAKKELKELNLLLTIKKARAEQKIHAQFSLFPIIGKVSTEFISLTKAIRLPKEKNKHENYKGHNVYIATRGSFESDQALWATEWIQKRFRPVDFLAGYTYLYEIIYPENRVVREK